MNAQCFSDFRLRLPGKHACLVLTVLTVSPLQAQAPGSGGTLKPRLAQGCCYDRPDRLTRRLQSRLSVDTTPYPGDSGLYRDLASSAGSPLMRYLPSKQSELCSWHRATECEPPTRSLCLRILRCRDVMRAPASLSSCWSSSWLVIAATAVRHRYKYSGCATYGWRDSGSSSAVEGELG
ncbi:hypothetical protein PsYK624_154080 [Phanerochaete sordida]|uniref:Uncharacterized protein n=1 Tax=Phanerochaete sordida TaxID=48140 RepID=A0A9P3LL38_9APHY|nr:hypothetical protein PsYK624_154080 [Phanerochaete sordida]